MTRKDILSRWEEIEFGEGLARTRRIARYLSVAAVLACVTIGLAGVRFGLVPMLFAFAGALVGWLIAERNALNSRLADWPTYRQYIDWSRVHQDLPASAHIRQK